MEISAGMLWYTGPVPPPVLANASCSSPTLQAQHQDSCQDSSWTLKIAVMLAQSAGRPSSLHAISISTADFGGVGNRATGEGQGKGLCKCYMLG